MPSREPPVRTAWYGSSLPAILLLVLAMAAVYGGTLGHDFLTWDDDQQVVRNSLVNPPTWRGVEQSWREPYWGLYVPVSYTFFAAEAALARRPSGRGAESLHPRVFHGGNLVLHALCVVLVYVLLRRLLGRSRPDVRPEAANVAAAAGALLFGLHPVQVESVAWVSEARGLLSAALSLVAMLEYLSAVPAPPIAMGGLLTGARASYNVRRYALASLAFVLALLAKPAAAAVPLVLGALELGLLGRPRRRVLAMLAPWLLAAGIAGIGTWVLQRGHPSAVAPALWQRPLVAGHALAFYLWKFAVPWGLCPDYGWTPARVLAHGWAWLAWMVPVGLGAVLVFLPALRKGTVPFSSNENRDSPRLGGCRLWLTAGAVTVAWLAPVLGLVPFDFQRISTVADRYLYLALLGPALLLAWLLAARLNRWTLGGTATMLVALAALAAVQAGRWKDTETLFTYTLSVNPTSAVAEYHLGIDLALEGKHAEAADRFSEALAVHPEFAEIHVELGRSLLALGRTADGIDELERALALNPDNLDAHLNLGEAMESQGKTEEARREYEAVLSIRPDVAMAHYNLGNLALRESGPQGGPQRPIGPERLAEAEAHFRAALRANRMHAKAHARLGMVLLARGRVLEAVEHERAALAIDPTLVEAVAALRFAVEQIPADSDRARQVERLLRKYDEPK